MEENNEDDEIVDQITLSQQQQQQKQQQQQQSAPHSIASQRRASLLNTAAVSSVDFVDDFLNEYINNTLSLSDSLSNKDEAAAATAVTKSGGIKNEVVVTTPTTKHANGGDLMSTSVSTSAVINSSSPTNMSNTATVASPSFNLSNEVAAGDAYCSINNESVILEPMVVAMAAPAASSSNTSLFDPSCMTSSNSAFQLTANATSNASISDINDFGILDHDTSW